MKLEKYAVYFLVVSCLIANSELFDCKMLQECHLSAKRTYLWATAEVRVLFEDPYVPCYINRPVRL